MRWREGIHALALAAAIQGGAHATAAPASAVPARHADASALYNAGTEALGRGDLGPAVAFLAAAARIDPRARDIRTNLAIARERVQENQGSGARDAGRVTPAIALSRRESWILAAALAACGALSLWMAALRPRRGRAFLVLGIAMFAAGAFSWCILLLRANEERRHPQAVVVATVLEVAPAPDERPLSPYLLGAGEEVRLGRAHGDLVEIRVGGNAIGWAPRSGLWRVADAARYTADPGQQSQ